MSNWIRSTLEEVCFPDKGSIISGPFGSNISSKFFVESGVPVIRGNNLTLGREKFIDNGFVYVTEEKAEELNCFALKNDLIFTAAGTLGQVGFLDGDSNYDRYVVSNKQMRARIDPSKVNLLYAYYWYSSPWMQQYFQKNNKGSTVPLLTLSELKSAPIIYPEALEEQADISRALNSIYTKISLNQKICSKLEELSKRIYDYWFIQFDFPNTEGKPYRSSGGKMVWNEELKREIPEGWKASPLGAVCSFRNGINYEKNIVGDKKYTIVNVRDVSNSTFLLNEKTLDEIILPKSLGDRYLLSESDVIIARSGIPGATRLLLNAKDNTIFCGFIICCTPIDTKLRFYLTYTLKKYEGTSATRTDGSILQNVSQDKLKNLKVIIPPDDLVSAYNEQLFQITSMIQAKINENNELQALRDWLLPMLMNGQATV